MEEVMSNQYAEIIGDRRKPWADAAPRIIMRKVLVLGALLAASCPVIAQTSPPIVTAGGMSDITVLSVDIGHFSYGRKIIHVFENSRNQAQFLRSPEKWQFMIEPLLTVRAGATGELDHSSSSLLDPIYRQKHRYRRHRLRLPLDMINDTAIDRAIEVIYARYPEARCKVGPQNVDVLPMTAIKLSMPDIEGHAGRFEGSAKLATKELSYLTSPNYISLMFDVTERNHDETDAELKNFLTFMQYMVVGAEVGFSVKSTVFNISSVITERIKDTDLYAKLNGNGSETYVSRDDLRRLTQSASTQLSTIQIIEDRASFDDALFRGLVESSTTVSADEAFFNSEQGKHTYDAEDLKPSILTEKLSKEFTYDSAKDQWSLNTSASGGGSFLDIVKADFSGSMSTSQLHEFLKKHSLETDIKGRIIVVKSVDLQQVNVSKFLQSGSFGMEFRNIERGTPKQGLKTTINLELETIPVGKSYDEILKDNCSTPAAAARTFKTVEHPIRGFEMSGITKHILIGLMKDELASGSGDPTGACTITVAGIPDTCTSGMTRKSCAAVAEKVGGVFDWKEGEMCSDD